MALVFNILVRGGLTGLQSAPGLALSFPLPPLEQQPYQHMHHHLTQLTMHTLARETTQQNQNTCLHYKYVEKRTKCLNFYKMLAW